VRVAADDHLAGHDSALLGQTVINPGSFSPWGVFVATYFLVIAVTLAQLVARRRRA
jgi:hypothetical protein